MSHEDDFFPGAAFINRQIGSVRAYLWCVLSDPRVDFESIYIVNVTTYRAGRDGSCILNAGDHAFIEHTSCVNYREGAVTSLEKLISARRAGLLLLQEPLHVEVLNRIRRGALESQFTPIGHCALLKKQDLV